MDQNLKVESKPINWIKPYPNNPRIFDDDAIDFVAASIDRYGWRQPIVADNDGVIVAGHVRHLAAQKLGMTEVPVHVARNLTQKQIEEYRILDNKTSEYSTWDLDLLEYEMSGLEIEELAGISIIPEDLLDDDDDYSYDNDDNDSDDEEEYDDVIEDTMERAVNIRISRIKIKVPYKEYQEWHDRVIRTNNDDEACDILKELLGMNDLEDVYE